MVKSFKGLTNGTDLICDDPRSVVRKCVKTMSLRLRAGGIRVREALLARGEREFGLFRDPSSSAWARQEYTVGHFARTRSRTYWLAVSLRFTPFVERFRLIQASLLLFEGQAVDPEKSPILRAEWDAPGNNEVHAQPHWHVYQAGAGAMRSGESASFRSAGSIPIEFSPRAVQVGVPAEQEMGSQRTRFHYAMAAQWHLGAGAPCRHLLTEERLLLWLGACIGYIRGQLPNLSREEVSS